MRNLSPPRALLIALWAVAFAAWGAFLAYQYTHAVLPGDPWQSQGQLVDFRDSVWTPGRYLLSGGNPYDTATYLGDVPWTQGLALYAPAWLLVALPLAPLPYLVANAIYQVLGLCVVLVLIRVVLRLTMPRYVAVATPIGLLWLVVWAAGRYALANVSTALVVLGVVLVLRGVWLRKLALGAPVATGATAVGVALTLLKPQYGVLILVVALAARMLDAVWRAVLAMAALSLPVLVACVMASGGVGGFAEGIASNLARSTSEESAAGLHSPLNVGIDLVAQLARAGVEPPVWVRIGVPLAALVIAAWLVVRSRTLIVLSAGVSSVLLLGFIHQFYDLLVLVLPLCVGIAWLTERRPIGPFDAARWLAASLPTVHVHRVSTAVVPGLTTTGADLIDTAALAMALVLSLGPTLRRTPPAPAAPPEPGGPAAEQASRSERGSPRSSAPRAERRT